jgi:hypothetical protein
MGTNIYCKKHLQKEYFEYPCTSFFFSENLVQINSRISERTGMATFITLERRDKEKGEICDPLLFFAQNQIDVGIKFF